MTVDFIQLKRASKSGNLCPGYRKKLNYASIQSYLLELELKTLNRQMIALTVFSAKLCRNSDKSL